MGEKYEAEIVGDWQSCQDWNVKWDESWGEGKHEAEVRVRICDMDRLRTVGLDAEAECEVWPREKLGEKVIELKSEFEVKSE